jgi:hypothetical protein
VIFRRRPEPERPLPGLADPPLIRPSIIPPGELRPLPGANAWPDAAVLLTYAELRQLVALHLELCSSTMPADRPWEWMRLRAGAIRDGEAPLLLSEVMDR